MKRAPITFDPTPETNAAPVKRKTQGKARRVMPAADSEATETDMLSARVSTAIARQFRSLAKLKGLKVQEMMETALSEYLERNRF
ncbi:MAG: hypothetical protein JOZ17_19510 [Acetobacteraceae bacterium]|nr:hypothetical protein [Acetobacteraceae bacterium]